IAEEMAYAWMMKIGTQYVEDEVFVSNFLSDFMKHLPNELSEISIKDLDFSDFLKHREKEKEWKSVSENKKRLAAERKELRLAMKQKYGYAEIDGNQTEIANWMVEPPGLFMGRGKHPLRGHWKPRVYHKDVTLNLDKEAPVPKGNWGKIVHDHNSMWLASWTEKLTGKRKYVWLHDSSSLRQQRDKSKYDNAKKLEKRLDQVRKYIIKGMKSNDEKIRKLATVSYLIDNLCMRVGDEKEKDEADTVGASTLRVEHVVIDKECIRFNFLGKDSVLWEKSLTINDEFSKLFKENLLRFKKGKRPEQPIFDEINSYYVNKFLSKAVKGLTAKNFRTFHATNIVRRYLSEHDSFQGGTSDHLKLFYAKIANLKAAITCNHKRTPPKTWESSLDKKYERLRKLKETIPKTDKSRANLKERILKADLAVRLHEETRDYNLTASLRNYIDPRVYKSWAKYIELEWDKIYTKTLQSKFAWARRSGQNWDRLKILPVKS
ncbi:MAG: DNA topoisomerase I, partial [Candidatus Methylarchaceae archaeon HK02M2]|nr:DNA topoisomerase I [Candidatus Methylarchaceae archaeon HK02M2]